KQHFHLEQVQDFTPTPMTLATVMFYTGLNPYTLEPIMVAKSGKEKQLQRSFFFWHKPSERKQITYFLNQKKRPDILKRLSVSKKTPRA
ncbi:MAG: YgiQ family radical SAM protein, partial [Salinivirgaceae bacterium]